MVEPASERDVTGRITAVYLAGVLQQLVPADPGVEGDPDQIKYSCSAAIGDDVVEFSQVLPSGRVTETARIRSARVGDRCEMSICFGEPRLYVRETIVFDDCEGDLGATDPVVVLLRKRVEELEATIDRLSAATAGYAGAVLT